MQKLLVVILAVCVGAITGCAKKSNTETVAEINGKKITMAILDEKIEKLPKYYQTYASQHKKEVIDELVTEELLYAEAKNRDLNDDPEVKDLINETTKKILISRVVEDETKKAPPVSDDDINAYYEGHKEEFVIPEIVRASHILTSTEEEAKKAQEELKAGTDFAEVAKKYSKDLTKDRGGDLGYFKKGQMIPEFEKACFELEVGKTSDIVKTRFGYHIIKLTDRKPAAYRKFEEVKENIRTAIARERQRNSFDEFVNKLKSKARIKINESLLTPKAQKEPAQEIKAKEAKAVAESSKETPPNTPPQPE